MRLSDPRIDLCVSAIGCVSAVIGAFALLRAGRGGDAGLCFFSALLSLATAIEAHKAVLDAVGNEVGESR